MTSKRGLSRQKAINPTTAPLDDSLAAAEARLPAIVRELPYSKVLCLADSGGHLGTYFASLGHETTSHVLTTTCLEHAQHQAEVAGVDLDTVLADFADFDIESTAWDVIVVCSQQDDEDLQRQVHASIVHALRPNGIAVLEVEIMRPPAEHREGALAENLVIAELTEELDSLSLIDIQQVGEPSELVRNSDYVKVRVVAEKLKS